MNEILNEQKYSDAFLKKLIAKAEAMTDKDFSQYTPADHKFMDEFFGYHLPNLVNQFVDLASAASPLVNSQQLESFKKLENSLKEMTSAGSVATSMGGGNGFANGGPGTISRVKKKKSKSKKA